MTRLLSVRPCQRCGEPTARDPRDKRCDPCDRIVNAERVRRWYRAHPGTGGRHLTAKWKLYAAAWEAAHREERLAYQRLHRKRKRAAVIDQCVTPLCKETFIRQPGGRRKFCWTCAATFYGRAYALRRKRPGRGVVRAA